MTKPRWTLAQVIVRMNYVGALSASERRTLTDICGLLGHEPTGEQVMVNPPLDTCYWCGVTYRDASILPSK